MASMERLTQPLKVCMPLPASSLGILAAKQFKHLVLELPQRRKRCKLYKTCLSLVGLEMRSKKKV